MTKVNKIEGNIRGLSGVRADLILQESGDRKDETHSKKYGDWEFLKPAPGVYDVQFYGRGTTPDDWIIGIEVVGDTAIEEALPIIFSGTPALAVSEGSTGEDIVETDINKAEDTMAIFSLTNLQASQGVIKKVLVYRKISSDTTYLPFKEFDFDGSYAEVQSDLSAATFRERMKLRDKPEDYDFRCLFLNPDNKPALSSGTPVYATHTNVTFNGVPDLDEYVEVKDLVCSNVSGGETGTLPGMVAELEWTDTKAIPRGSWGSPTYKDSYGNNLSPPLTWAQAQKIIAYVVYMFISSIGNSPDYPRPGITPPEEETEGDWYHMGEHEKANASIRCPQGSKVSFWVGFTMERTTPTTTQQKPEHY